MRFPPKVLIVIYLVFCTGLASLCASEVIIIKGLRDVSQDQIKSWIGSQIEFIEAKGATMARADDCAYFLENALRSRGFPKATVDWKLTDGPSGKKQIVLTVDEGPELMVGKIKISGNQAIEDEAIVELITAATRKRLESKDDDRIPFVASDIKKGIQRVDQFYRMLGFLEVKVDFDKPEIRSDSAVDLDISVDEGSRHKVGTIEFPDSPDPKLTRAFEKAREDFSGKNYSAAIPGNLTSRLAAVASDAGFYNAQLSVETISQDDAEEGVMMNLVVKADWGERVSVSAINIRGNEKVKRAFFDRHFEDVIGRPYSPRETNTAVEELLATGAFESVRTDIVKQEDGTLLLEVDVEEGMSRQVGVFGGFGTYEGPIVGFEFRNINMLGSVRTVDAHFEYSNRGGRGELEWKDPWFLWSEYSLTARLFTLSRRNEGYSKWESGGGYEFSRKFGQKEDVSLSFFGRASYTNVYESTVQPVFLGDREYFTHFVGISIALDKRDSRTDPRRGFMAQTSIRAASSALGSQVEFLSATGRLGYYIPVGESTLRLSARAGVIAGYGDTNKIPIDLRFYNGGANSVRSFQERDLGPRDALGNPVGGEFYSIFNIEYDIPLPWMDGLSVVPFADAGNLLSDAEDASLQDLRYALGLGLRYRTPIGPLRLEYGYNPDRQPGDPQGFFHIGFGYAY